MKLHELNANPPADVNDVSDLEGSVFDDEDFWEAIELLEDCLFHMGGAIKFTAMDDGRRRVMQAVADDVKQFLDNFVVGAEAVTTTITDVVEEV